MAKQVHLNIPVAHFHNVLSWDKNTIDQLVDKAVDLTVKVGLRLDEDKADIYLKEAESKGAKIDWNNRAVMFNRKQIEQTIEVMRKTKPVPEPLRPLSVCQDGHDTKFDVGNGANLLFDWEMWQARAPEISDLVNICQWAQGYDDIHSLFQPVMLKDINLYLEPLYSYALMCKYCHKRVSHGQPTEPVHVKYLDKMAHIVEKHRGYFQPVQMWEYINPPFRLGLRAIETMLARVDTGVCNEMGIGAMSVSGMSAPVTVAGAAVTIIGEILAGLTFFRILRPGFGLCPSICSGNIDLRTARVSYFNMHAHLQNLAAWELMVRGLGVDSSCLTWYRDANEPGMQALYEYGMAQSFFSSVQHHCHPETGGLACGNIFSPEQAVLDIEIIKEFNELLYGFEVNEEVLGLEEVVNARFDQGVHLSSEHTLRYMNNGVPFSDFLFRGMPAGAQHDKQKTQTHELMEKARKFVVRDIKKGARADPDVELSEELYECVKQAADELGIDAPTMV